MVKCGVFLGKRKTCREKRGFVGNKSDFAVKIWILSETKGVKKL